MLQQFSVTNHRSIRERTTISLLATRDSSLRDCILSPDETQQASRSASRPYGSKALVPVLALYGANAAGKSNLIHALLLMRSFVAGEHARPLKDAPLPQEPFAFTEGNSLPTTLEVIYYFEGVKYAYGFSFDRKKIIEEYLYHWPNGREALIFSRTGNNYQFRENISEQQTLAGRTPENRLYLVSSNEWNCPQTAKAYLWFTRKLSDLSGETLSFDQTLAALKQGGNLKGKILHEMLVADLGIVDVRISDSSDVPQITMVHQLQTADGDVKQYPLLLSQESQGTQRFFSRIGSWIQALEMGGVLIVDEIEASLHPLLTRHLIETIQDKSVNRNQAQLIFTTHDVGLLDQNLLRRDQIWFAQKDEKTAETEIYALTDFSPRKSENISRGYLQGRYGAIPFIGGSDI